MIEIQIHIPATSNQGEIFGDDTHAKFERLACDLFGGITREPATAEGMWVNDDGVEFRDTTYVYVVAVSSIVEIGRVGELVEFAKANYDQEAIFIRYLGQAEVL